MSWTAFESGQVFLCRFLLFLNIKKLYVLIMHIPNNNKMEILSNSMLEK